MYFEGVNSHKVEVCEALLRRAHLHNDQQKYIENILGRMTKGNEGEHQLNYHLKDMPFDEPHLLFFNFETVRFGRFRYQMDAIFICERFVLIIEGKHIAGDIYYDAKTHQLWRFYNGEKLTLSDPFSQVLRHEDWMVQFLQSLKIDLPVLTAVVVTTANSTLHNMPEQFAIFKVGGLRMNIQRLCEEFPKKINRNLLQYLYEKLTEQYQPQKWQHPFKQLTVKRGALCHCGKVMVYKHGNCHCVCGNVSKEPLLQGLHDYKLLVNDWITNKEFRQFFGIENEDVSNKLLKRLNFDYEGKTKSRKYFIRDNIWSGNVQFK